MTSPTQGEKIAKARVTLADRVDAMLAGDPDCWTEFEDDEWRIISDALREVSSPQEGAKPPSASASAKASVDRKATEDKPAEARREWIARRLFETWPPELPSVTWEEAESKDFWRERADEFLDMERRISSPQERATAVGADDVVAELRADADGIDGFDYPIDLHTTCSALVGTSNLERRGADRIEDLQQQVYTNMPP